MVACIADVHAERRLPADFKGRPWLRRGRCLKLGPMGDLMTCMFFDVEECALRARTGSNERKTRQKFTRAYGAASLPLGALRPIGRLPRQAYTPTPMPPDVHRDPPVLTLT